MAETVIDLDDWEEWDPSRGTFWQHVVAGSCAGVAEHVLMFPVDTWKTHLQFARGRASTLSFFSLLRREGFPRLWRGMPTILMACIPSHAAYFSAYEYGKQRFGVNQPGHHPLAAAAAGAMATTLHDAVLTPMDVVKQRLQLGYYRGTWHCLTTMTRNEGLAALFRSYPTTLLMNMPFAATVVATNEGLRKVLTPEGQPSTMATYMAAGAGAGAVAAVVTNPLDVVKTRLQTDSLQDMVPPPHQPPHSTAPSSSSTAAATVTREGSTWSMSARPLPSSTTAAGPTIPAVAGGGGGSPLTSAWTALRRVMLPRGIATAMAGGLLPTTSASSPRVPRPQVALLSTQPAARGLGAIGLAQQMMREEGAGAFFKGARARMMVHAPSMAISWSTYEMVKSILVSAGPSSGASLA